MMNRRALMGSAAGGVLVDDVFSTDIYTGTGSSRSITNGIDLDGEGGLVWIKSRISSSNHALFDTERGAGKHISSDSVNAESTRPTEFTSFNSNGFSLGTSAFEGTNKNGDTYVGWTFRKEPKFFDVVTYTGNGAAGRTVAHDLGQEVGVIIIKRSNASSLWPVFHRANTANPETDILALNTSSATFDDVRYWNDTLPTDSVFSLGNAAEVNASGGTYVAYLFAHDTDASGVIQCGSFTTVSNMATVTLGWSPQFVITKRVDTSSNWEITDIVRGSVAGMNGANKVLKANLNSSEQSTTGGAHPSTDGTGMQISGLATGDYVYMAIRAEE